MSKATKICQDAEDITCTFDEKMQIEIDDGTVVISAAEYRELVSKASALDILTAQIERTGTIEETVVRSVTGTTQKEELVSKKDADAYWAWYMEAKKKAEGLSAKVATLEHANVELRELIRQNGIGQAEGSEEDGGNG